MPDAVIEAKTETIVRCIARARAEHAAAADFATDYTHQDAAILNVMRACEAAIDIGARLMRLRRLPPPQHRSEIYIALADAGVLERDLAERLRAMVGFRNRLTHGYGGIDVEMVEDVIEHRLVDLNRLCVAALSIS